MYWTQEDVAPIASALEGAFGPQGRYSDMDPRLYNVRVSSVKYGPLWYGDMDSMESLATACASIKKSVPELTGDTLVVARHTGDNREIAQF
jgi:hypothetical protein